MKNERGFTLIEMLIVLLIISVLILVTIPNVTKHFASIDAKGCDAYVNMVQGQVEAYRVETMKYPTMQDLVDNQYLQTENTTCPNGETIIIEEGGHVKTASSKAPSNSNESP
ncbi:competence type IV pilus major pilin ComGC [Solibacillus sp. FSL H8-0538]|uniref:competence type IV pilus major pilin ComGC n=1 Tax=Solibacillus sp. FSL H8-0538 TaxID=2921400 RepID=UPI0030F7E10F